jgi:hypothetical protein
VVYEDMTPYLLLSTRPKTKVKSYHNLCGDMLGLIREEEASPKGTIGLTQNVLLVTRRIT